MINHTPVSGSTAVKDIWYNDTDHTIVVETTSAKRYTFYDQSREVYQNFVESTSKGQFFNQLIRSTRR